MGMVPWCWMAYVRDFLRQSVFFDDIVPVLGVRPYDVCGKLRREVVMGVAPALLVFLKEFGLFQLAHIVIVRRAAGQERVLPDGDGARFRQVADHDGVVKRARRFLDHTLDERALCSVSSERR